MGPSNSTVQWYEGNKPVTPQAKACVMFKVPTSNPHTTVYTCVARNFTGKINTIVAANLTIIVKGIVTMV